MARPGAEVRAEKASLGEIARRMKKSPQETAGLLVRGKPWILCGV